MKLNSSIRGSRVAVSPAGSTRRVAARASSAGNSSSSSNNNSNGSAGSSPSPDATASSSTSSNANSPSSSSTSSNTADSRMEQALKEINLPKTGFLSMANPNQEIYSKSTEPFDPRKKGGRYKSEFIWNTNWQESLKREEQLERQRQEFLERQQSGAGAGEDAPGVLGFGLLSDMNRMDVDLSAALMKKKEQPPKPKVQPPKPKVKAPSAPIPVRLTKMQAAQRQGQGSPLSRMNAQKLQRSSRLTKNGPRLSSSREEDVEERAKRVALETEKYESMKQEFQVWTLALTLVGGASTYTMYDTDICASYLVGALSGYMYLRLLGKSVDAVGADSVESSVGGISSQPRLLIPVVLALVFNRWNLLYAEQAGVTLQLLPILAGFFTYKIAVFGREFKGLLDDMSAKPQSPAQSTEGSTQE